MATRKKPWHKDLIKLNWIFISVATILLFVEILNAIEIAHIRNDLFNYYLYP
jgi:hypothetical protein